MLTYIWTEIIRLVCVCAVNPYTSHSALILPETLYSNQRPALIIVSKIDKQQKYKLLDTSMVIRQ